MTTDTPKRRNAFEWVMFWLVLLPVLALAVGVKDLRISAETRVLAGPEDPVRLDLERFEARFAQNNNLLFVVAPSDGSVFTEETLEAIDFITERGWLLPYSSRVDSITNFPLIVSDDGSFGVSPLADEGLPHTEEELASARARLEAEPWVRDLLLAEDAGATGINMLFIIPPEATAEIAEIMGDVRDLRADFATAYPDLHLYVTGNIAMMNTFADSARRDISWLIPLALLVVLGVAALFLRDRRLVATLALYVSLCCLGAMGAAGWMGHILNPATVAAPIIIMTLSLASIIHLMSGVQVVLREKDDIERAVAKSFEENRYAITITILTTAFGFISMNVAASPPLRELGNIVVAGLVIALLMALFVVPPILRRLKLHRPTKVPSQAVLGVMIGFISNHRAFILLMSAGFAFACAGGISHIRLDDDFIRYFDRNFEYRVASDFAEDNLTGLNLLEFAFESGEPHGINEPAYFERLARFTEWLREQPGVEQVTSLSDKLSQIHHVMDPEAPDDLPQSRAQVAQYLLLFELSLPPGNDIADRINADRSATRVTVSLRHMTSSDIRELNARADVWLHQNNPVASQEHGHSINFFFATLSLTNIQSMIGGTIIALIMISFIVLVSLRDYRLGLVSLIANLLPVVAGFGIWGYAVGEIGLASSVVAAMTFGIVVDDTIHLLLRYKKERSEGSAVSTAMKRAYTSVGRAMTITSLALATGFMLLVMSGFEINSSLGLFTTIIVICALVVDLTLVPAMVLWLAEPKRKKVRRQRV